MDVWGWLRELGLERYERAFRDNDVDADVLPELTADDLIGLGVASIGHRRKLLAAIAALRRDAPFPEAQPAQAELASSAITPRPPEAERRQLTVMFVDLAGSTALSTRLDPEDMREVIRAYQDAVAGEVARFEGQVAKYMGDGVLAYFGFPQAHEDDAEHAVRAGLDIVGTVGRLPSPEDVPLAARVGIATGLVVVGDLVGSGAAQEQAVVGETPNLAARLQALAEPDSVVIAAATRRLVGGLFECVDLGPTEAKGFAGPVRAYRVLGVGASASRFEAFHAAALAPLVGREEEVDLLLRRWGQAKDGEGRVVLLSGEPGVGKSRLLAALQERLDGEPHTRLRHFCSPHRRDSPLHPIVAQLERAAGFARGDLPEARLGKLEALLAPVRPPAEDVALLAELLSLPLGGRYTPVPLAPQRRRERTFEALLHRLEGLARRESVLMVFEDAHWIDPSSRELLDLAVARAASLRVLLLVTFRPEFEPPWTGQPHVTALVLNRLGRREAAALVRRVAGSATLPEVMLAEIVERTDGVPLFLEELTKAVLEAGAAGTIAATPPAAMAVPATLHASLLARLDRLGPTAREVAQVGAVIGREFSHELLADVAGLDAPGLASALDQLTGAGLVFRRAAGVETAYLFKHALVRDAAYGTLLRDRRRRLHGAIARALEERWKAGAADGPEIVAHHFAEAGLPERAAAWWLQAGQLATTRSAYVEAVHHLRRGLDALSGLPSSRECLEREFRLWRALGAALAVARSYAGTEVGEAFGRALAICRELGEEDQLFPVLYGLWVNRINRGEFAGAEEAAREFAEHAERQEDAGVILTGHTLVGSVHLMRGEFAAARAAYERTIALYRPDRHRALVADYVTDRRVVARQLLAHALGPLGSWDLARRCTTEALAEARGLGHPATEAYALWLGMVLWQVMGELDAVEAHAERLAGIAQELRVAFWQGISTAYRGWAQAVRGEVSVGIPMIRDGITTFRATGAAYLLPQYLTLLATAHRAAGDDTMALAVIAEAIAEARRTGEGWSLAEILRLQGEVLAAMPRSDLAGAEASLRGALELAQAQDAKGWELRAATSLARLWAGRGERARARGLLAPVHASLTASSGIIDLKEAEALLNELA